MWRKRGRKEGRKHGKKNTVRTRSQYSRCYYNLSLYLPPSVSPPRAGFIMVFDSIRSPVLQQRLYSGLFIVLFKQEPYLGLLAGYSLWWWRHEKLNHKPRDTRKTKETHRRAVNANFPGGSISTFCFLRNCRRGSVMKWLSNKFGWLPGNCDSVGSFFFLF